MRLIFSNYRFNGKEKDSESGLNYYGARYYNSGFPTWLSVYPLMDKYPSLSPYVYCANNPVKLIDPDGRKIIPSGETESVLYQDYKTQTKDNSIIQKELQRLEDADEIFRINIGANVTSEAGGGNFVYNKSSGEFDVNIGSGGDFSPMEKLSHELKHADQYMDGKIGFEVNGNKVNTFFNSEQNERDAYTRQKQIGGKIDNIFMNNYFRNIDRKRSFDDSRKNEILFKQQSNKQETNDWRKATGRSYYIHKSLKN